jgi:hypothetical protein
MRSIVENRLRMTRSDPPGLAGANDERRQVFLASMLVYEELLEAAKTVDYIARPLPLFYALSQAGRAIVAAHGEKPTAWGHGLGMKGGVNPADVLATMIAPRGDGLFQAVTDAVGGRQLSGPVALGALWSALPDLAFTRHEDDRWAEALVVIQTDEPLQVVNVSPTAIVFPGNRRPRTTEEIDERLQRYADGQNARAERVPGAGIHPVMTNTAFGPGVLARFVFEEVDGTSRVVAVSDVVPKHRYTDERWLIPRVGDAEDELPPLLLWWVLLFGLSLLARYEPAVWRAALDVERPMAVPLEDLMDEALTAIPHWLLWSITKSQQVTLPRP